MSWYEQVVEQCGPRDLSLPFMRRDIGETLLERCLVFCRTLTDAT